MTSTETPPGIIRPVMPELDTVRGVAILLVVFFHGFGFKYGIQNLTGPARWFVAATLPGWAGVNLFFVLSGFLITGILVDAKDKPDYFKRFYTRRALRILPIYYAVLLILWIAPTTGWFLHRNVSWQFVALSAFFLANVTPLLGIPMQYGVLWSLAVEEHFYLLWPAVVKFVSRRSVAVCAFLIFLGSPILRTVTFSLGYNEGPGYTWLVADGLAAGAFLAVFIRETHQDRKATRLFSLLCLAVGTLLLVVGIFFGVPRASTVIGAALRPSALNLLFVGTLAVTLLLGSSRYNSIVNFRILKFFGYISYGLYLIHMLAFDFVDTLFAKYVCGSFVEQSVTRIFLRFTLAFGTSVVLSFLSRKYFEDWFLQFKNRRSVM